MNAKNVIENLKKRFPNEPEYLQAVEEVLESIEEVYNQHPEFEKAKIESFKNQVITQYTTSKDTQWLRSQFDYFVEGYKDRPKHENNIS